MIIGDPFEFAIWLDPVAGWTVSSVEGLYILIVDGRFLTDRVKLGARAVTIWGESEFWSSCHDAIVSGGQTLTRGRGGDALFRAAYEPRFVVGSNPDEMDEGVCLTPMETSDNGWKIYLFLDEITDEDVIVYGEYSHEKELVEFYGEMRLPSGRTKKIISDFIGKTKYLDNRAAFGIESDAGSSRTDGDVIH